jgi:hypothetical protein
LRCASVSRLKLSGKVPILEHKELFHDAAAIAPFHSVDCRLCGAVRAAVLGI